MYVYHEKYDKGNGMWRKVVEGLSNTKEYSVKNTLEKSSGIWRHEDKVEEKEMSITGIEHPTNNYTRGKHKGMKRKGKENGQS